MQKIHISEQFYAFKVFISPNELDHKWCRTQSLQQCLHNKKCIQALTSYSGVSEPQQRFCSLTGPLWYTLIASICASVKFLTVKAKGVNFLHGGVSVGCSKYCKHFLCSYNYVISSFALSRITKLYFKICTQVRQEQLSSRCQDTTTTIESIFQGLLYTEEAGHVS